jgi:hypothetical protein
MKIILASCLSLLLSATMGTTHEFGMYLSEKPIVPLEKALPIALREARDRVPNLDQVFALHSVGPRVFKGDKKGQHWQFLWQELPFKTRLRGVVVRVYMKDGSTTIEQFEE